MMGALTPSQIRLQAPEQQPQIEADNKDRDDPGDGLQPRRAGKAGHLLFAAGFNWINGTIANGSLTPLGSESGANRFPARAIEGKRDAPVAAAVEQVKRKYFTSP
jgi:hypothetical protein